MDLYALPGNRLTIKKTAAMDAPQTGDLSAWIGGENASGHGPQSAVSELIQRRKALTANLSNAAARQASDRLSPSANFS
jgi:hypothetical protein